jgi:dipeptidyl aminopeptidase/acylaminoacyl peptidase
MLLAIIVNASFAAIEHVSLPYLMSEKFDGRDLKLEKVLAENDAYTRYYITYMSGSLKISGIMNVPKGKGPFPVVITAHGFIDPKVYTNGRGLKREQDYLARHGFIALHPDYRNHNGSDKDPEANLHLNLGYTEDVINAVYALRASNFKFIDKGNIGLLGHSLGGGVGLNMMVSKPGLIKAYVLFAPVSMDYKDNYYRWIVRHDRGVPAKYGTVSNRFKIEAMYGSPESNPVFWGNMSAKTFIGSITEPVMVHQGTADKDVPYVWSEKLSKALKEKDKNITYYEYKGEPHEFINAWPLVMQRSTGFFREHLK